MNEKILFTIEKATEKDVALALSLRREATGH